MHNQLNSIIHQCVELSGSHHEMRPEAIKQEVIEIRKNMDNADKSFTSLCDVYDNANKVVSSIGDLSEFHTSPTTF